MFVLYMNKISDKITLFLLTLIVHLSLISILLFSHTQTFEKVFIFIILVVQYIFFIGLYLYNNVLIDFVHVFMTFSLGCSVFMNNHYISWLCISILLCILYLWCCYDRCIMNHDDKVRFEYFNIVDEWMYYVILILFICIHFAKLCRKKN